MRRAPGTLAFLIRWHLAPFVVGAALAVVAAYQLWTYQPPTSSALDAVASSLAADYFVPVMWAGLVMGIAVAGRAFRKAWLSAHSG